MAEPDRVAVLALVYRTLYRNCYAGAASLLDELANYSDGADGIAPTAPGGISLLGMIGSQSLSDLDWELIEAIPIHADASAVDLAGLERDVSALSPERCEALLHAWPDDPRSALVDQEWAEPYIERWDEVAAAMARLEPLTWDRERLEEVALAAAATGWWNDEE